MRSEYIGPGATLLGAVMVTFVIHRGFAEIADACEGARVSPVATAPSPRTGDRALPAPEQLPRSSSPHVEERDEALHLRDRALKVLEPQLSSYRRACYEPRAREPGTPPDLGGYYEVTLSFDANGNEIGRQLVALRESDPNRAACVKGQKLASLKVPAPGQPRTVKVNMVLP